MKVGIILGSNELDRVAYAGMHALISATLDNEVVLFATMDGVKAFLKNPDLRVESGTSKTIRKVMRMFSNTSGKLRNREN